ncbi:MAG: hypothetical protein IPK80_30380 [Nannocystis sp.]|jgi:membrane-bound ClpP family serine protease|nr:hypothetical protein [Nannocystis sp.]
MKNTTAAAITLLASTAVFGAGALYLNKRRPQTLRALPADATVRLARAGIIPIIEPTIDLGVAERVLGNLRQVVNTNEVTVLLHTAGGSVSACVMIANALREVPRTTAIVPYMALSGGTLIALNASELHMGPSASLSALDPIVCGERVRHLADGASGPAAEYERAVRAYLRETLYRQQNQELLQPIEFRRELLIDDLLGLLMGHDSPHDWPIQRQQLATRGLRVYPAAPKWADYIDGELALENRR